MPTLQIYPSSLTLVGIRSILKLLRRLLAYLNVVGIALFSIA
ncbi:MAG: hypothetical protein ACFCVD_08145 [Nodosilinea sp.]